MSSPRKTIPLMPIAAPEDPDAEIRGCAELEPYALRVIGDSMSPEFLDGHVIVLDPGFPASHGAYVAVDVEDGTILRQFWIEDGRTWLKPLNGDYPTIEMKMGFRVRGVVMQRAGKRRADRKRYD